MLNKLAEGYAAHQVRRNELMPRVATLRLWLHYNHPDAVITDDECLTVIEMSNKRIIVEDVR